MPSAASRSRFGVRYRSLTDLGTRLSICTDEPVQPWSSDRISTMFCAAAEPKTSSEQEKTNAGIARRVLMS